MNKTVVQHDQAWWHKSLYGWVFLYLQENVISEAACQTLCHDTDNCEWYTWFDQTNKVFYNYCFLFKSCNKVSDIRFSSFISTCIWFSSGFLQLYWLQFWTILLFISNRWDCAQCCSCSFTGHHWQPGGGQLSPATTAGPVSQWDCRLQLQLRHGKNMKWISHNCKVNWIIRNLLFQICQVFR